MTASGLFPFFLITAASAVRFKVTFGNESDTRFLRRALQAIIQSPVAIKQIEFIESEIPGLTRDSRSGVYDVACVDEKGNQFIVEMQLSKYPDFIQRMNRDGGPFLLILPLKHAGSERQIQV